MRPKARNDFFNFMWKEHNLVLTETEIDEIEWQIKSDDKSILALMRRKINFYRMINIGILGILGLIAWIWNGFTAPWILGIFVTYNFVHMVVYFYQSWKRDKHGTNPIRNQDNARNRRDLVQ